MGSVADGRPARREEAGALGGAGSGAWVAERCVPGALRAAGRWLLVDARLVGGRWARRALADSSGLAALLVGGCRPLVEAPRLARRGLSLVLLMVVLLMAGRWLVLALLTAGRWLLVGERRLLAGRWLLVAPRVLAGRWLLAGGRRLLEAAPLLAGR